MLPAKHGHLDRQVKAVKFQTETVPALTIPGVRKCTINHDKNWLAIR